MSPLAAVKDDTYGSVWIQGIRANPHGAVHCEAPCHTCGVLTRRRAVVGLKATEAGDVRQERLRPELVPACEGCEARRVRRQLERIAANGDVLPRLRDEAGQQLAAMDGVVIAA